jgi:hypothetical protein
MGKLKVKKKRPDPSPNGRPVQKTPGEQAYLKSSIYKNIRRLTGLALPDTTKQPERFRRNSI